MKIEKRVEYALCKKENRKNIELFASENFNMVKANFLLRSKDEDGSEYFVLKRSIESEKIEI